MGKENTYLVIYMIHDDGPFVQRMTAKKIAKKFRCDDDIVIIEGNLLKGPDQLIWPKQILSDLK